MRAAVLLLLLAQVSAASAAEFALEYLGESRVDLENPHDLKLSPDGRYLMVADVGNDRVVVLDPESLEWIASFGADHQDGTHDIDFDAAGLAYVADTHNSRVTIYRLRGTEAELIGEVGERLRGPEGVLAHPNGGLYVAGAWSGNLVVFRDGEVIAELGGLSSPHDVELAADGSSIWLADAGNSRLLRLSPELDVLEELGRDEFDFDGVRYLDVTASGMLVAADKNNHVVKFIDAQRRLLHVLGDAGPGRDEYRLRTPEGVEIRNDVVWIADSGNDRVLRYRFGFR